MEMVTGTAGAGAVAVAVAMAAAGASAVAGPGAIAAAGAGAVTGAFAVGYIDRCAIHGEWRGWFQLLLIILLIMICFWAANAAATFDAWLGLGAMLLFLGLLTLINAPFDWAALGLTRALLRRGLRAGCMVSLCARGGGCHGSRRRHHAADDRQRP